MEMEATAQTSQVVATSDTLTAVRTLDGATAKIV